MDYKKIISDIRAKNYAPIYFLQGAETYFIDLVVKEIEHGVLSEAEMSFNQAVLYGKESNAKQVIDQAMQYPMMSPYRVVIVKEAQSMSTLADLESYIKNPSKQTILVIAHKYKTIDKRKKKFWDAIKKNAVILETKALYDNQVPPFIMDMVKDQGLKVDNKTAFIIAEHLGSDLSKISNEIEKLALNLSPGTTVTLDHVQKYIGISKDYNIFELQTAIGQRNKPKCYKIIKYFSENEKAHPIQMNVGALYSYFCKILITKKYINSDNKTLAGKLRISPFFTSEYKSAAKNYDMPQLRNAFSLLHDMDKFSKGVDRRHNSSLAIYQEFLFKLLA